MWPSPMQIVQSCDALQYLLCPAAEPFCGCRGAVVALHGALHYQSAGCRCELAGSWQGWLSSLLMAAESGAQAHERQHKA